MQVSDAAALAVLEPDRWELVAADRPRPAAGTGVDAVGQSAPPLLT